MPKLLLPILFGAVLGLAALPASAGDILAKGSFVGASDHETSGSVHVTDGSVDFQDDFSLDGAPDPKVGFGKDGTYDPATTLSALNANSGAQSYALPEGIDLGQYNEVYVWCEKFAVPLGVAKLQ